MLTMGERSELLLLLEEAESLVREIEDGPVSPSLSANAAAGLDTVLAHQVTTDEIVQPKKRVRREKRELDHLREESSVLEMELGQLQLRLGSRGGSNEPASRSARLAPTGPDKMKAMRRLDTLNGSKRSIKSRFVWQNIAERQFQGRCRAQRNNQELREALKAEMNIANRMQLLLQRRIRLEQLVVGTVPKYARGLPFKTEADIFRGQLLETETALLQMEKVLQKPIFADTSASFCEFSVADDPTTAAGVTFLIHTSVKTPYGVPAAENVLWRLLTTDAIQHYSYYHRVVEQTKDVVAQSFGLHYKADAVDVDTRGQYTIQRFKGGDWVAFVWKALLEPQELNGVQYHSLRCHQTGWIRLQYQQSRSPLSSIGSLIRSYSRVTIELQDDVAGQEELVSMLKGLAQQGHEMVRSMCVPLAEKLLVGEDWELSGGHARVAL